MGPSRCIECRDFGDRKDRVTQNVKASFISCLFFSVVLMMEDDGNKHAWKKRVEWELLQEGFHHITDYYSLP